MKPISEYTKNVVSSTDYNESAIEQMFFQSLLRHPDTILAKQSHEISGEGLFFIPQYKLGNYRADFVIIAQGFKGIYTHRVWPPNVCKKYCIECDGKQWHSTPEQKSNDIQRDKFFKQNDFKVYRYGGSEIYKNSDIIVNFLIEEIKEEVGRG